MEHVDIGPDDASFRRCIRALNDEAGGTDWQHDAAEEMEEALRPGVNAVRGALFATMHTSGLAHGGEGLRQAVSESVQPVVAFHGPRPGAMIRADKNGMPRSFANAPRRLNDKSFRHPIPTGQTWVTQIGAPGWFDDTLERLRSRLAAAASDVLERRARRISRKAP